MTAIILAAGQGKRLRPLTEHLPKCLIPIGGKPILAHMLERVKRCGLKDVVLVAGFEADCIRWRLNRLPLRGLRVRFVINPRFSETNNLYSLWLALRQVSGPAVILNGDDFFNWQILDALQRNSAEASAAVDFSRPLPPDAMKVVLRGPRLTALGKTIPDGIASGNAVGLYRFSACSLALLRAEIEQRVSSGRVSDFYVAAISALASRVPVRAVSTGGLTWGEVDDYADLAAAPVKLARILAEEQRASLGVAAGSRRALCEAALLAMHQLRQTDTRHELLYA